MQHGEAAFESPRGRIYYQWWQPQQGAKALMLVAHGGGEHSGRYHEFAAYFVAQGYAVAALDHYGHGRSFGRPGYVERIDDYLQDFRQFHNLMTEQFPALPALLVGHSMGGLIASLYLLRAQQAFTGCVLSGAVVETEPQPGAFLRALVRLLSAAIPTLPILKLDAHKVSRDPMVVRDYLASPLVYHGKLSARLLGEMFAGADELKANAGAITLPVLVLHGEKDGLTQPSGSKLLHELVGSADKTLKIYPGLYHEIFNEPERLEVLADVLRWCDARRGN